MNFLYSLFFGNKKTVESIMSTFNKQVKQLDQLSNDKLVEADLAEERSHELLKQSTAAKYEADAAMKESKRAKNMANKILDFLE